MATEDIARAGRVAQVKLAIYAATPGISPEEAGTRAEAFVSSEEQEQLIADYEAAAATAQAERQATSDARWEAFNEGRTTDGKSSDDVLRDLQGLVDAGQGW